MLLVAESSEDLESIICSAGDEPVVVAFLDEECPASRSYAPVFRAAAEASSGVFVEAWAGRVADYALRLGVAYLPVTIVFHRCRPLAGLPGAVGLEDLRLLLEKAVPQLLEGESRGGDQQGEP
jgi:thioredoxin-like negative regulator of GroEL